MATEPITPPEIMSESTFSRPMSLYQPERYTPSLVDSSSYSPFPTIGGSRHDPFGLDAYLLHPEDNIWAYIAPVASEPYLPNGGKQLAVEKKAASTSSTDGHILPRKGIRRMSSNIMLKRGSPLSQPPVPAPASPVSPTTPKSSTLPLPQTKLHRRRSKSLDSSSPRPVMAPASTVQEEEKSSGMTASATIGSKRGLSRLFARRKSIPNLAAAASAPPPVPPIPAAHLPLPASSASEFGTKRSASIASEGESSVSSASSSDHLATPKDSPRLVASVEDALFIHTEDNSLKKRGFKGWFNRRASKMPESTEVSPTNTAASSPNLSGTSLPKLPSAPTVAAVDPPSRICPSPDQKANAYMVEIVRRASYRKLGQLKRPSPHPLAQHLRRQATHLPNELASAVEAGQKVYPRSVNVANLRDSEGLVPAQRGLYCLLGVKVVLDQLDAGRIPTGPATKRPSIPSSIPENRRQRSMKDFIRRRPFEDRNHVFYPDGQWSPVSIARPGFGVWDLDFSAYIQALADVGEAPAPAAGRGAWPVIPRPSFGGVDELKEEDEAEVEASVLGAMLNVGLPSPDKIGGKAAGTSPVAARAGGEAEMEASGSDEGGVSEESVKSEIEVLITPADEDLPPSTLVVRSASVTVPGEASRSSFRLSTRAADKTWDDSDDEDEVEDATAVADEEDEENLPLSKARRKSSMPALSHRPTATQKERGHVRRSSQPLAGSRPFDDRMTVDAKRRSHFDLTTQLLGSDDKQQAAMAEVARARERRQALLSGEIDRQAEGQLRRAAEEAKRRSHRPSSASSSMTKSLSANGTGDHRRRSSANMSTPPLGSSPHLTTPHPPSSGRRYHSFYELPTQRPDARPLSYTGTGGSTASFPPPGLPTYPSSSSTLAAGMAYQQHLGSRGSMMFYPQPQHPGMMFPLASQAYSSPQSGIASMPHSYSVNTFAAYPNPQMPGSRSSVSLLEQKRTSQARKSPMRA